jgi:hypothetical protein
MAQDLFHYDRLVEGALRGMIGDVLARVSREGLRSAHHFYIGFGTRDSGVTVPERLLARYPDEMTIVLQHQYWDLDVGDEAFSVSLSFDKEVERLTVPFAAIRRFADPSVNFALEFAASLDEAAAPAAAPPTVGALPAPATKAGDKPKRDAEVVTLDSFRKR